MLRRPGRLRPGLRNREGRQVELELTETARCLATRVVERRAPRGTPAGLIEEQLLVGFVPTRGPPSPAAEDVAQIGRTEERPTVDDPHVMPGCGVRPEPELEPNAASSRRWG